MEILVAFRREHANEIPDLVLLNNDQMSLAKVSCEDIIPFVALLYGAFSLVPICSRFPDPSGRMFLTSTGLTFARVLQKHPP